MSIETIIASLNPSALFAAFVEGFWAPPYGPLKWAMWIVGISVALLPIMWIRDRIALNDVKKAWLSWPTLDQYRQTYPHAATRRGIRCYHCHSGFIANRSFSRTTLRIVSCKACNNILYRIW